MVLTSMTEEYVEELIQKYADGIASEEEIMQLMKWYHATEINEVKWAAAKPGEEQEVYNRILHRLEQDASFKKTKILNISWLKVAVILLLIVGLGFVILQVTKPFSGSYVTILNPSGKIQVVTLPDSSKLCLNALTEIRYKKSFITNRDIELKGEAFFDVAHDLAHPFVITAGGLQTTVVGTSFNIKAYDTENKTTISVVSGRVKISNNNTSAVLNPAMQYQFNRQNKAATTATIDTNSVIAWKKGKLHFEGESFSDIAASLERWYGIKIVFNNPAMGHCRYYMSFGNKDSLEKILSVMADLTGMSYSIDKPSNTITLSGNGCE